MILNALKEPAFTRTRDPTAPIRINSRRDHEDGEPMTDNDALSQASAHLATARQLGRSLRTKMPALFNSRQLLTTIETVTDELSAAIDLINSTLATERERTQQLENAIDRLELITAGDEQLIDDLGAAIETAQIELVRLERQHDLLRSRLNPDAT